MTLATPKCWIRSCKHLTGVIRPDGTELSETNACRAYPKGIPLEIAYGPDKHTEVRDDQDNSLVYEKARRLV